MKRMTAALLLGQSVVAMDDLWKHLTTHGVETETIDEEFKQRLKDIDAKSKIENKTEEKRKAAYERDRKIIEAARAMDPEDRNDDAIQRAEAEVRPQEKWTETIEELKNVKAQLKIKNGELNTKNGELDDLKTKNDELKRELETAKNALKSGSSRVVPSLLMMVVGGIMLLFVN